MSSPLPRLFIISSGTERVHSTTFQVATLPPTLLLQQLALIPPHLRCMVQLREKALNHAQLLHLAKLAKGANSAGNVRFVVNGSLEVARLAELDGVHLPEGSAFLTTMRQAAPTMLIGCSVHSLEAAQYAAENGADYLYFSPIFDTPSKRQYGAPQGLKALETVCKRLSLPVYALGGITVERIAQCRNCGAYGIAALSLFQALDKLPHLLEQCNNLLES